MKRTQKLQINASKQVGQEINVERSKQMLLTRHQNAGQNCDTEIEN
jgi:hypothetical protein